MSQETKKLIVALWKNIGKAQPVYLSKVEALVLTIFDRVGAPVVDPTNEEDPELTPERSDAFSKLMHLLDEGDEDAVYDYLKELGTSEASIISTNLLLSRVRTLLLGHAIQD